MEPLPSRPKATQPVAGGGVRIEPAAHKATIVNSRAEYRSWGPKLPHELVNEFMRNACRNEVETAGEIIQSSFEDVTTNPTLAIPNGFVNSAIKAYNEHHHLIIRPEDVWFSILVQINVYINAHAEELRSMFVAQEDKKELKIYADDADSKIQGKHAMGVDWAKFGFEIGKMIEQNIVDPTLRKWFMPTSPPRRRLMKKYFSYKCGLRCGLPSITLLGEKSDWEDILQRLERLKTFGDEPTVWHGLLKPILKNFIHCFDSPDSQEARDFWQTIAHYSGGGSGPTWLSGWITAFCFWDARGKCLYSDKNNERHPENEILKIDSARYHHIDSQDVPNGFVVVPVLMDYNGFIVKAEMVAGSIGAKLLSSGRWGDSFDTLQPTSGWLMYKLKTGEEVDHPSSTSIYLAQRHRF